MCVLPSFIFSIISVCMLVQALALVHIWRSEDNLHSLLSPSTTSSGCQAWRENALANLNVPLVLFIVFNIWLYLFVIQNYFLNKNY